MDLNFVDNMNQDELKRYVEFLLWHYRVVDAFWFLYVEEEQSRDVAEHFNERVWAKASELAARKLRDMFSLTEGGLKGFLDALEMYPWTPMTAYKIEANDHEIILSTPHCPPQEARLKRDLGEYNCKEMHRKEFENFAATIDPRIHMECLYAPPDPHPPELFCQWRFTLNPGTLEQKDVTNSHEVKS